MGSVATGTVVSEDYESGLFYYSELVGMLDIDTEFYDDEVAASWFYNGVFDESKLWITFDNYEASLGKTEYVRDN